MCEETKSQIELPGWERYVQGVLGGTIPACEYIKLACKRHVNDLERSKDESFQYYFDAEIAARAVRFFSRLQLTKSLPWPGKKFIPEPWQQFIVVSLLAWVRKDAYPAPAPFNWQEAKVKSETEGTGVDWEKLKRLRRFRKAHVMVPRKNGKSPMLAGLGLYGLIADDEMGAEVYSAATRRDQAKIIWDYAVDFRKHSGNLAQKLDKSVNALFSRATSSKFIALGADEDAIDGLSTHIGLVDEYQNHKTADVLSRIGTGRSARRQPMIVSIGTAGSDRMSPCWNEHEYAANVLKGEWKDEAYFAFLAEADEDDVKHHRWDEELTWRKANPNLGISKSIDYMIEECAAAKNQPSKLNDFLRLDLNIWTQQLTSVIPMDKWRKCAEKIPVVIDGESRFVARGNFDQLLEAMAQQGRYPFGGLDLSEKIDLTAFVLIFPPSETDPLWVVAPRFWVPKENIEKRTKTDRVPYEQWVNEGLIVATEGSVVDYDAVRDEIFRVTCLTRLQHLAVDPHAALQLNNQLVGLGVPVVEVQQGWKSMSDPTKELLAWVQARKFNHLNHPVLNWNAQNLALWKDAQGNCKPDKSKARERIDGVVALINAMYLALTNDLSSVYTATRGILTI